MSRLLGDVLSTRGDDLAAGLLEGTASSNPASPSASQLSAASRDAHGTDGALLGGDSDDTRLTEVESRINAGRDHAAAGFERVLRNSRRSRWLPWRWLRNG
jgi:hypothetical protein